MEVVCILLQTANVYSEVTLCGLLWCSCSAVILLSVGFQIKMMRPDSSPAANEMVYLSLTNGGPLDNWVLKTDSNGMVVFSLVTTLWPDSVSLQVCLLHKIKEKRVSFFKHVT